MVEIKDHAKLKQTLKDLMFTETLYYEDLDNDFVWLLHKLDLEIDIKKTSPYQYLQTTAQNHHMYYKYLQALYDYYHKNGHMDIMHPSFTGDNSTEDTIDIPTYHFKRT